MIEYLKQVLFSIKKIKLLANKINNLEPDSIEYQICNAELLVHKIRKCYAQRGVYLHSFSKIDKEIIYE